MEPFNAAGYGVVRSERVQGIEYPSGQQKRVDLSLALKRFPELADPKYVQFYNPGVFTLDGIDYMIARCSNYFLCEGKPKEDWWQVRVEKEFLMPMSERPEWMIELQMPPGEGDFTKDNIYRPYGFEDVRAVISQGQLVLFGTVKISGGSNGLAMLKCELNKVRNAIRQIDLFLHMDSIVLLSLDSQTASVMTLSNSEKNWVPFVHKDTLYNVYSITPLRIFRTNLSTGVCTLIPTQTTGRYDSLRLRGSTPLVQTGPSSWVAMSHITVYGNPPLYTNRWVKFEGRPDDGTMKVSWVSSPFKLLSDWIEFTTGMLFDGKSLHVASGVQDCGIVISEIADMDDLREASTGRSIVLPKPIPVPSAAPLLPQNLPLPEPAKKGEELVMYVVAGTLIGLIAKFISI